MKLSKKKLKELGAEKIWYDEDDHVQGFYYQVGGNDVFHVIYDPETQECYFYAMIEDIVIQTKEELDKCLNFINSLNDKK